MCVIVGEEAIDKGGNVCLILEGGGIDGAGRTGGNCSNGRDGVVRPLSSSPTHPTNRATPPTPQGSTHTLVSRVVCVRVL